MKTIPVGSILSTGLTMLSLAFWVPGAQGAYTLTTLSAFSNPNNGFSPGAGLVQGRDGLLYGTANQGGAFGKGAVFSLSTNGAYTLLYSFTGAGDGGPNISQLMQGKDGKLYGSTESGGANSVGTIFSITTNGTLTTLFSFPPFRGEPKGPLVQGHDGNFYGTTRGGGSNYYGSVFRLTVSPSVTCTDLHSFHGASNGILPFTGLIQGSDGILYGTTISGGISGFGSIFGISTNGGPLVLSYLFNNGLDGSRPVGSLVQAPNGKLYGTASGQAGGGTGTVFSITTSGAFTTLHRFTGGANGSSPLAGLTLGSDNKFYGITPGISANISGVIYRIDPNGVFDALSVFDYANKTNGQVTSSAPLILGADGNFYGTTTSGGDFNRGTVFKFGLSSGSSSLPIITQQPPPDLSAFTGGIAMLPVSASDATAFQWFKGSSKVANSSRIFGATTSTLTISNLTASDAGVYHVVVSNLVGSTTSSDSTLTVLIPDAIKPTLAIVSPRAAQNLSNLLFTASGTARDTAGVAAVFYQLNGGDWTNATGTTNWTAALSLTPGANTLRVYAVDTSTNFSTTNSVTFTYVVSAPVTVQIIGQGTVTPNLNGQLVALGKSYSMTAKAGKGFKFLDWSGSASSNTAKLSFVGASNLNFTATFIDITRPVCIITVPGANKTLSNTIALTSGKAKDNAGVTSVWFRVNSGLWYPANTTNSWTNWTAPYPPLPIGPNTAQAYAVDAAGNTSLTNTVKFNYKVVPVADWAPDSLNGLMGNVASSDDSDDPNLIVAFDPGNFTQTGDGTNADHFGVGTYVYTKLATNLAELSITNFGPLLNTNDMTISVLFTNHYSGVFTNDDGEPGTINLSVAGAFAPLTLVKRTITSVDSADGSVSTIKLLADGTNFTQTITGGGTGGGTYSWYRFSPIGGWLILSYPNGQLIQVQVTFTSSKGGTYFSVIYGTFRTTAHQLQRGHVFFEVANPARS